MAKISTEKHPIIIMYDFDGVIIDSEGSMRAAEQFMKDSTIEWNHEELSKFEPLDLIRRFEMSDNPSSFITGVNMFLKYEDLIPSKWNRIKYLIKMGKIVRKTEEKYSDFIPGVVNTLSKLYNSGFIMGICTNSEGKRLPHWLEKKKCEEYISAYTSRTDKSLYGIKPEPRTLLNLLARLKKKHHLGRIDKDRVYFCGDNPTDIWAAQNARIKSVAVLSGHSKYEELAYLGADYLLKSINELDKIPEIKAEIKI